MTRKTRDDLLSQLKNTRPTYRPPEVVPLPYRPDAPIQEGHDALWESLSELTPCSQQWMIPGWIPLNTLTLFAGSGGIGKSLVLLTLAAYVSTGRTVNLCGVDVPFPLGSVILMSAEDDYQQQLLPKLIIQGADLDHIHTVRYAQNHFSKRKRFIELDKELDTIESKIKALATTDHPVKLLIIDPITYFLGDIRDHIQKDVANFILQLNNLAQEHNVTILLNKHRRKEAGGHSAQNMINEVGGAAAWTNSPRQALGFLPHPEEENTFLIGLIKSNLSVKTSDCLGYSVQIADFLWENRTVTTAKIVWNSTFINLDFNSALSKEAFTKSKLEQAKELLYNLIAKHQCINSTMVSQFCTENNILPRTKERALQSLRKEEVICSKRSFYFVKDYTF